MTSTCVRTGSGHHRGPPPGSFRRTAWRLITARGARSIGQGILTADFALYLEALHWPGTLIGVVLTAVLGFGVLLTALIGPLSDRVGRKAFLLGYEAVVMLATLVALFTHQPAWLIPAAIIGGFGRGGASSPLAPAVQAWLSQVVPRSVRGRIYSLSAALGLFGFSLGALLGALPDLLQPWLPGTLAYKPIFVIALLSSLGSFVAFAGAPEIRRRSLPPSPNRTPALPRHEENRLLRRLAAVNILNGLGIGLTGPLIAYWFSLRYGIGPGQIGPIMALAFAIAGVTSLATGSLSARVGLMRAVVWMRSLALVLLIAMPLMPTFTLAAVVYVLRMACNLGSAGPRQGINISLVQASRRGAAASLSAVSMQVPRAIGPTLAGLFFAAGALALPFYIAASFQAAYLVLYNRAFRAHDPNRRQLM